MMMGLATLTVEGAAAVLFYLIAYLFMNLGAFAIVAFLRNLTNSEDVSSFRGLIHRAPVLVITFAIFLLSLLGLPPLAGFPAKFQIFSALFHAGQIYSKTNLALGNLMYATLFIGGINTVFSAVYYLRVLKIMILDQPLDAVEGKEVVPLPVSGPSALFASLLAGMIFVLGIFWGPVMDGSEKGVTPWTSQLAKPATAMVNNGEGRP
jgi:NADH-quinone oxidoreductase subunit N